ncbi:MAG: 3-methylcrotonyl-CoA carboxylase, partial [Chloroflexaceae bacterium]|nr:3-methylcrotonyl-CoA carboxylase [Chloroflexaceae bacterium]
GGYYFLEMNTRLQVEHPVTELVTGLDLVHLQFRIAAGERLPFTQDDITFRGHAIEVRLYAEDPVSYLPATGTLALLDPPTGPGVRVDSGLTTGDAVTVYYDPMIAKLIVHGADRPAAIARLSRALDDYAVLGLTTNLPLLRAIAAHPAYAAGDTHTGFLEANPMDAAPPRGVPPAVLAAAAMWEMERSGSPAQGATAASLLPFEHLWRANGAGVPLRFRASEANYLLHLQASGPTWAIDIDGQAYHARRLAAGPAELVLELRPPDATATSHERFRLARDAANGDLLLGWRGATYRLARPAPLSADSASRQGGHGGESLTAPMPGTLIKVLVSEGETVKEGQPLLVLEAMKMEHTIVAPHDGVVQRLPFAAGASVAGGVSLIELDDGTEAQ